MPSSVSSIHVYISFIRSFCRLHWCSGLIVLFQLVCILTCQAKINFCPCAQTAAQRPDPKDSRQQYEDDLKKQVEMKRVREAEEKLKRQQEEEKLEKKIKEQQDRIRKEYEEEVKKKRAKEEAVSHNGQVAKSFQ